jgi:hypothetical protein
VNDGAAGPPTASPSKARGRQGDEHQPPFPGERSAPLLPSEVVRIKPMQVVKFDRVVVARRMQHHTVRRRARLFVADIGVARETDVMVDGSPPVGAVPDEFAAGLRSAPRLPGSAIVSWPVRRIAPPSAVAVSGAPPGRGLHSSGRPFLPSPPLIPQATERSIQSCPATSQVLVKVSM